MNFPKLILYLEDFFQHRFDFTTITDNHDNPFIQISLLQTKRGFVSQSYGFYVTEPSKPLTHKNRSTDDLSGVNILVDMYLVQDRQKIGLCEMKWGCVDGTANSNLDIIICSVIADLDDAKFLCKTILSQIEIFVLNNSTS